jgi:hypothetical protein
MKRVSAVWASWRGWRLRRQGSQERLCLGMREGRAAPLDGVYVWERFDG